jgi:hypothetical protein
MDPIVRELVELLSNAETPVYSAYRWLGRRLGRELALAGFLELLSSSVDDDVVQLWEVDPLTHERTRIHVVSPSLEERYRATRHSDAAFDPFGMSLTLGSGAAVDPADPWELDLEIQAQRFTLRGSDAAVKRAQARLRGLFPDLEFQANERVRDDHGGVTLSGSLLSPDRA